MSRLTILVAIAGFSPLSFPGAVEAQGTSAYDSTFRQRRPPSRAGLEPSPIREAKQQGGQRRDGELIDDIEREKRIVVDRLESDVAKARRLIPTSPHLAQENLRIIQWAVSKQLDEDSPEGRSILKQVDAAYREALYREALGLGQEPSNRAAAPLARKAPARPVEGRIQKLYTGEKPVMVVIDKGSADGVKKDDRFEIIQTDSRGIQSKARDDIRIFLVYQRNSYGYYDGTRRLLVMDKVVLKVPTAIVQVARSPTRFEENAKAERTTPRNSSRTVPSTASAKRKSPPTADISYDMDYEGIIIRGTSTFTFSVVIEDVDESKNMALVRLQNIRRYWTAKNGQSKSGARESNIRSMPFTDPRGYYEYGAPAAWGDFVSVGDTTWISLKELKNRRGEAGDVTDTGKLVKDLENVRKGLEEGAKIKKALDDLSSSEPPSSSKPPKSTAKSRYATDEELFEAGRRMAEHDARIGGAVVQTWDVQRKSKRVGLTRDEVTYREIKATIKIKKSGTYTVTGGFYKDGKFQKGVFGDRYYATTSVTGDAGDQVEVTLRFDGAPVFGNTLHVTVD